MSTLRRLARNRALLTFMLGHFTVDMYGGLLPILYPLAALEFALDNEQVGYLALCYSAASSLSQPAFGYLADRYGSRLLAPLSLAWAAVMFALTGLAPSPGTLMVATALAGLGSGAYHPLGASNAAMVTGEPHKNTAMSIYTVGGTSGYALGPLLGALAFGLFGRQGTVALLPVGLLAATLVLRSLARLGIGGPRPERALQAAREPIHWRALLPVLGVVMLKNWVYLSVLTFVPLWYREMGYGSAFYGALTSLVIACGAVGTIVGGLLGDRLSERSVLMASLTLALPALFLFVGVPGPIALVTGPLFGMLSDSSLSITLVMAQRCLPGRVGLASGFILGMGFVTGGIGVPITGRLADRIGTPSALMVVSLLLAAAIACALLIPRGALARARGPLQPAPATD